jgi:4-amino-4-deoxy-L-arabinose transferase-like glycosyltransferase
LRPERELTMTQHSDPRSKNLATIVVAASTLIILAIGLWEFAGPVLGGHFAVVGARGIIADNFVTWKIIAPVRSYSFVPPQGTDVYAHHPWGTFWILGACRYLLGRHDWIPRIYPVVMSTLMPGLLFVFGRSLWGNIPGALCALGWAVLPITLSFAQFPGFEVPVVFGCIWVGWAVVRFRQTGQIRWGFWAILGILFAAHTDWTASLYIFLVYGLAVLLLAFAPARSLQDVPPRRALRFWVLGVMAVFLCFLFYIRAFDKLGLTQEWLRSAEFRATGHEQPFKQVLLGRRFWLETMFTQIGIIVVLLGAVVMLLRLALTRRFEEWLPLLLLLVTCVHYFYFKNAADIHIYWPLPFAAQFALSLGSIGASLLSIFRTDEPGDEGHDANYQSELVVLGVVGLAALLVLPDGLRGLNFSRNSGGRFNEHGRLILQDVDKTLALRFFAEHIPEQSRVALDVSMRFNWSQEFALHHPTSEVNLQNAGKGGERYRILDSRFTSGGTLSQIAGQSPVTVVGPYWLIDGDKDRTPLVAYRFVEREPKLWERFLLQAHDPMQRIEADPLTTWELRLHYGQAPNPEPDARPLGLDQMRIYHNLAVSLGDKEAAKKYREQLEHKLDRTFDEAFPNGSRLLGQRLTEGVLPRLELYFLAPGPLEPNLTYSIWSNVKQHAHFSFVIPDDTTKSHSLRFSIPPSLWKAGMIYVSVSEIRKRPGLEEFEGAWAIAQGTDTRRITNEPVRKLLELN